MTDPKLSREFERDPARRENPFDAPDGYSGQEFNRERMAAEVKRDPGGGMRDAAAGRLQADGRDIPPENGRRAFFDPATGEVHGAGSGAGGGNPGEDFDSDPATGDAEMLASHPSGPRPDPAAPGHRQNSIEPDRMPGDASGIDVSNSGRSTGPGG